MFILFQILKFCFNIFNIGAIDLKMGKKGTKLPPKNYGGTDLLRGDENFSRASHAIHVKLRFARFFQYDSVVLFLEFGSKFLKKFCY